MAEQHTLTVKVTGDSSQLVAALNKAQAELAQLDRQSNQTNAGFGTLGTSAGSASGALGSMSNVMAGIGWGVAISGAIAVGTELYNIGRASQVATNTFNQLQGGAEQASKSLAMLQEATNFTVPDTTLMSISNLYTQMGLATDPAEVARLAQMGAELGMAMGQSAEEAMRTFSALLANQSIELLDQFGISSGQVRERIKELQDANAGLAREQAFVTAVLEIGAVAQDRVNVAIEKNVSSVDKLTTRFQNFAAVVGQDVAGAVEGFASGIEQVFSTIDRTDQLQQDLLNEAVDAVIAGRMSIEGLPEGELYNLSELLAIEIEKNGSLMDAIIELNKGVGILRRQKLLDFALQIETLRREEAEALATVEEIARSRFAFAGIGFDFSQAAQQIQAENFVRAFDDLSRVAERVRADFATGIITNDELATSSVLVQNITAQLEEMMTAGIAENNPTVVALQKMRDELSGIADNAIRARNEMSLTTALGLGLPPEQRLTADILKMAGIEGRQAEYLTGQRTQLSELFESSVLPLLQGIETQFGEDEAARVGHRIALLMKEGIAQGFESDPVQLMQFILGNVDYRYDEGQARSIVVQAGDTLTGIARDTGVSVQFLAEINKLEDPNKILAGQELVVEVGARVTRLLPPEASLTTDQLMQEMGVMQAPTVQGEGDEPVSVFGAESLGLNESLATAQELQTTLVGIEPPLLTPSRLGLLGGDVAEVGVVEVIDSIGQKLQDISSRIYQVSMTVNLDANIRTNAGFKIIPITMAELANDISESARIFRLAQGAY